MPQIFMGVGFFKDKKKKNSVQQVLAILLLSLSLVDITIVDLFLPEFCERENAVIASAKVSGITSKIESASQYVSDDKDQDRSESLPCEDDCFCCSSHVLPSAYFKLPSLPLQSERLALQPAILPSAPPLKTFHPPRAV